MKSDVFEQYVSGIVRLFRISKEDLFSKSKKRELVDARHLLYYLCSQRPMRISYIQKYMEEHGYMIKHSSIIHGISSVEEKIKLDRDYLSVVKKIGSSI